MRRAAILLMGPTGTGKSELALQLAEHLPLEIVSVDSALVYRGMDIGTAKPDAAARARVPHHLIDIRDPAANFSAGEFVRDATAAMETIWKNGRQPLLVGGTMLYFHALTEGIAELPEADPEVRADIDRQARQHGWGAVHEELARVDPAAAARIHVNDPQRIQRALEVFRLTGETITRLQRMNRPALADVAAHEYVLVPVRRSDLHARLERRFRAMMAGGFLQEVQGLHARADLTAEHPSMRAVGYRQLWRYLSGSCSLEEASNRAVIATRQLAKRQLTWLRRRAGAARFDPMHPDVAPALRHALTESVFAGWSSN
jgi:tRNA dimethylallyltransferase